MFDIDGVMRGKYMGRDKFLSSLRRASASATWSWAGTATTSSTTMSKLTGWHTAYPDAAVRLLPETTRLLPFENDLPLLLGEFAGRARGVCPRGTLRRVLKRAKDMGFDV